MDEFYIAEHFTKYPGGRYKKHGGGSGEEFRDSVLIPRLKKHVALEIHFGGAAGYPASFIEEAFGGLLRTSDFTLQQLEKQLKLVADSQEYEVYVEQAWQYMKNADDEKKKTISKNGNC